MYRCESDYGSGKEDSRVLYLCPHTTIYMPSENAVEEAGESDYGSGKEDSEFWGNDEEEREGGACRERAGGRNNYNKEEDGQVSKRFRAEGGAGGGRGEGRGRGRGEERAGSSESTTCEER
jgi:hypothetical protein